MITTMHSFITGMVVKMTRIAKTKVHMGSMICAEGKRKTMMEAIKTPIL